MADWAAGSGRCTRVLALAGSFSRAKGHMPKERLLRAVLSFVPGPGVYGLGLGV